MSESISRHGLVDGLAADRIRIGVRTMQAFSSLVPNAEGRRHSAKPAKLSQDKLKGRTLCRACQARRSTRSEPPKTLCAQRGDGCRCSEDAANRHCPYCEWHYASLGKRGYEHFAECRVRRPRGSPEDYLPIIHLVFARLKTWLIGIHRAVSHQHLQAYLNEFTFIALTGCFYPFKRLRGKGKSASLKRCPWRTDPFDTHKIYS